MLLLILLLCLGTVVRGSILPFRYDEFHYDDTKPPVYIEETKKIQFYTETWKFVTTIDMTYYQYELQHVRNVLTKISTLCTTLNTNVTEYIDKMLKIIRVCKPTVTIIENIVKEMEDYHWITSKSDHVITDAFLQQLEQDNQTNALSNIYVDMSVAIIKENEQILKNNSKDLNDQMNHLQTQINDITTELNKETNNRNRDLKASRIKNYLQDIILYTTVLVTHFRAKHESVVEALHIKSVTHQMLLPPTVLLNAMKGIYNVIQTRQKTFPFDIYNEPISKFYDIATVEQRKIKNHLIIVYVLPIINPTHFTLHKLTAYPRNIEGEMFQLMLPEVDEIALNSNSYTIINQRDIKKCYQNDNNTLICPLTGPVVSTERSGSCAVDLLTNFELSNNCDYKITKLYNELWLKVYQPNCWLYVFPKPQKVTINCYGTIVDSRYASRLGTLTLQPGCSAKTEHVQIVALQNPSRHVHNSVPVRSEMNMNWKDIMKIINATVLDNIQVNSLPRVIYEKHLDILQKISTSVRYIEALHEQSQRQIHHTCDCEHIKILIYVAIAVVLFTLVCAITLMVQICCKNSPVRETPSNTINDLDSDTSETQSYIP